MDVKIWQMWQKVVTNKDSEQNKVVYDSLQIIFEGDVGCDGLKFEIEILPHKREMEEKEILRLCTVRGSVAVMRACMVYLCVPFFFEGPKVTSSRRRQKWGS